MLQRFQLFVEGVLQQAERHGLCGELIVVEWNPPPGPRLHQLIAPQTRSDQFVIRFIEVPAEAHRAIRNWDVIPLFQMIAKNVGIRRARGEFIIATNPDLLFSDELFAFLASPALQADRMYRIDRHDVPASPPATASLDELLTWCQTNVLRVHTKWGTFPPLSRWTILGRRLRSALWKLRFTLPPLLHDLTTIKRALRTALNRARQAGMRSAITAAWRATRRLMAAAKLFGLRGCARPLRRSPIVFLPLHLLHGSLRLGVQYLNPLPKLHTNGCGDFTMLARNAWFRLGAYPELPIWSMHIDSLFCYMAVASGLSEHVLKRPRQLFHLEHDNSWVVLTPDDRLRTFATKPWLDLGLLAELWSHMYCTARPVNFNTADWGLADRSLDEVWIVGGEKRMIKRGPTELAETGS